jgi:hypothetical protein
MSEETDRNSKTTEHCEFVMSPWLVGPFVRYTDMDPGEPPNNATKGQIEAFSPHYCDDDGK